MEGKVITFFKRIFAEKKYRTVFIICISLAVLIVVGAFAAKRYAGQKNSLVTAKKPNSADTICLLDGQNYTKDKATRHPLAVMIENHPDARPQSGLIDASIVYEAITEGGITRYMAIYGPTDTKEIGPIRSARLFFMDYVKEYDAFYAHAGGNEDAMANIDAYSIKDLSHFGDYFYRDSKGQYVASEHTLYSSTDKLYEYAAIKKFDISKSSFTAMKFKPLGPVDQAGKGVEINFSSPSYKVTWSFDPATNKYSRSLAGAPHKDRTTDQQITSRNIIIQTVERTYQPTGSYGSSNYVFTNIGSGPATVLRDGKVINATWKKDKLESRTKFFDESNKEITMNPGNTWYEIIPPEVTPSFI
ncbi:MAG: DUF3048 domain-containing protein [bacterium]